MTQKIVIVTGISGVGKSSILKNIAYRFPVQVLNAGQLILHEVNRIRAKEVNHDELRTLDIVRNQEALKAGFDRFRDPEINTVFLDAHVVVDTPSGLQPLGAKVFESVGATSMIFLENEPRRILENRLRDPFRNRPLRDMEALARQQTQAKENAEQIADQLGIPFFSVQCEIPDDLIRMLEPRGFFHACQTVRP